MAVAVSTSPYMQHCTVVPLIVYYHVADDQHLPYIHVVPYQDCSFAITDLPWTFANTHHNEAPCKAGQLMPASKGSPTISSKCESVQQQPLYGTPLYRGNTKPGHIQQLENSQHFHCSMHLCVFTGAASTTNYFASENRLFSIYE